MAISRCRDIATSLVTSCGSSRLPERVLVTENDSNEAYDDAQLSFCKAQPKEKLWPWPQVDLERESKERRANSPINS